MRAHDPLLPKFAGQASEVAGTRVLCPGIEHLVRRVKERTMPANFTAKDVVDHLDRCIIENPLWHFMELQHPYIYCKLASHALRR